MEDFQRVRAASTQCDPSISEAVGYWFYYSAPWKEAMNAVFGDLKTGYGPDKCLTDDDCIALNTTCNLRTLTCAITRTQQVIIFYN